MVSRKCLLELGAGTKQHERWEGKKERSVGASGKGDRGTGKAALGVPLQSWGETERLDLGEKRKRRQSVGSLPGFLADVSSKLLQTKFLFGYKMITKT